MGAVAASECRSCRTAFPRGLVSVCPRDGGKLERAGRREFHPLVGRLIAGRYRVLYERGRGSVATVFGAEHTAIGRAVALKVLHEELGRSADVALRFGREARAASRVTSPHVVSLLDFGQSDDGALYLAMELLEGPTLQDERAARGALPWREAAAIARDVAVALAAAHAAGVVHRDLKPENVLLAGPRRVVKVLDFGIAKLVEPPAGAAAPGPGPGRSETLKRPLTLQGVLVGTPGYVSPEAIAHEPVGPPADLYALGAILFELLAGRPPFVEPARAALLALHAGTIPPRVGEVASVPGLPAQLEALVAALLAKRPQDRPADAATVARALATMLGSPLSDLPAPASIPPEGEPAGAARPTERMDVEALREELRPTLLLETDAERTEPRSVALDPEVFVPTTRPSAGRGRGPALLVSAGAVATLVLGVALAWRLLGAGGEPPAPRAAGAAGTTGAPDAAVARPPSAAGTPPASAQPGGDAAPDHAAAGVRPPPPARGGAPRKGAPIKRGAERGGRGGGSLDIERDYP